MVKVFVSIPIQGKSRADVVVQQQSIIERLRRECPEAWLVESYWDYVNPLRGLAENLARLSEADVIYFVKGWQEARGCRIEHLTAEEYGKKIIEEE